MKKIILLLTVSGAISATAQPMAQPATPGSLDALSSMWAIDVNVLAGSLKQDLTTANSSGNYLNGVNVNQGNLSFKTSGTVGFDAQLGWFPGRQRHWGIGTGIMFLRQHGHAVLDNYHAEYQSTDGGGNVYRQVVTPEQPIDERLKISNFNIPLVAKYKNRFSEKWGFTADAGLLFNLSMTNKYSTNASFDYEAIYKYSATPTGTPTVYDNSPAPGATDFLITKAAYLSTDHNGNVASFFSTQQGLGRGVGLGVKPTSKTGSVSYTSGSVGFLIQPSLHYFLSDRLALNFGIYYLYQAPKNNAAGDYTLTKKMGDYSSVLNNVTASKDQSYGINVGIRFIPGKARPPMAITSQESMDPTICGKSDGMIILHGMPPGSEVMVDYNMNGTARPGYSSTVTPDGSIKLTELAAGSYDNISVTAGRKKVTGAPVNLVNPQMYVTIKNTTNPTAPGECDGTITLGSLQPGRIVSLDYDFNGTPQPTNAEMVQTVAADGTLALHHLCAGTYTHLVAKINSCAAYATDIVLKAPAPPPPPAIEPIDTAILSSSIYFDLNKATISDASRHTVDYAARKLNEDKYANIIVYGYTDNTGSEAKNKVLSLKRAEVVKAELVRMGVEPERITVMSKGAHDPIGDNKTASGKALNRRAVLKLDEAGLRKKK